MATDEIGKKLANIKVFHFVNHELRVQSVALNPEKQKIEISNVPPNVYNFQYSISFNANQICLFQIK